MQRILSKREKTILFVTITVLVFSLFFNFAAVPVLRKKEILDEKIKVARMALEKYRFLLEHKEQIKKGEGEFFSRLGSTQEKEDTFVNALSSLEAFAGSSNIRIIDIRPQAAYDKQKAYQDVIIEVRAEGDLADFFKFIYAVENSLQLLKIKKIQLSAKANSPALEGNFLILQPALAQ